MVSFRRPHGALALLICVLFASTYAQTDAAPPSIPDEADNQDFFATTQAIFANGNLMQSSCGSEQPEILRCIRVCNSPGLPERSGCCCVVVGSGDEKQFFVGLRGGCRYNNRLLTWPTRYTYVSSPGGTSEPFFDDATCEATTENVNGSSCTCSLSWSISKDDLESAPPLPSPSLSPSPVVGGVRPSPPPETPTAVPTLVSTPELPTPDMVPVDSIEPSNSISPTRTPTVGVDTSPDVSESPDASPSPSLTGLVPPESTSTEPEVSVSPDDDGVCVDERYLTKKGFNSDDMVHKNGLIARVLCPVGRSSLPCGTVNHKVRVGGKGLSYAELCNREGMKCDEAVIKVNSVYSHMWSEMKHEDVVLTMYDVRYPEAPQRSLHSVMRGLRSLRNKAAL